MRRTLAWTLVAATALLAGLWFAFDAETAPALAPPHSPARHVDASASTDSAARAENAAQSPSVFTLEHAARTPTEVEASAEVEANLTVRVTGDRRAASAGAKVWLFAHTARGATFDPAAGFDFASLERRLAQADETRVCDSSGAARFRQRAGFVIAIARAADGRIGWNVGEADTSEPLEIKLVRDFDVEVLVRESDGRPAAGVPVVLRRVLTVSSDYVEQRTDSAGRATLRHAGALLSRPGGAWHAQLGVAATDPPSKFVTLQRPPSAPLEFTLAPYGSVELVLGERADASGASAVRAILRSTKSSRPRSGFERWPTGSSTPLVAAVGGSVLFEHVALGEEFEATLVHGLFESKLKFKGPTQPGERVVVRAEESGAASWTARVIDEQGQPWRGALVARANEGSQVLGQRRELTLTPDADGRLCIEAPELPPREDARVLTFVSLDGQGREVAAGRAQVQALSESEDLGEIVLHPVELLASGLVIDWRGQPVAGARVALVDDSDAGDPKPRLPFEAHTDAAGRFELQFALDESLVALQASAEGRASRVAKVVAGAREVRLALQWGGRVQLEIASLPPGRECAVDLLLALTPSGAPFDDMEAREFAARRKGAVELDNVPAGVWDFVVAAELVGAGPRELARVPSVAQLDEAHPSADAGRFDVRALIQPIVISASVSGSDERWFGFSLRDHPRSPDSVPAWSFTRATSTLLVPAALAPFDLRVQSQDCLDGRFEAVRGDLHVVLQPAPWIEIVLAADAAPLPEGQSYCAALAPLTSAPVSFDYRAFDANGVCRLQAKSVGAMRVALGVCASAQRPLRDLRELPQADWPQIEVSVFGPQRLVVSPSRAALNETTRVRLPPR